MKRIKIDIAGWYYIAVFVVLAGCAKIAPPPGGAADRTGPAVINTVPENLAAGVPLHQKMEFQISEWYDQQSFEDAFFISPEPQGKIKFRYKLKKVIISFSEGLSANRTYLVSVGSGFRDLNHNSMDSSYALVFSTGYEFAHGSIRGRVIGGKNSGLVAALFDLAQEFSLAEDKGEYLTQTGKTGAFSFNYLPAGDYRLIIFDDKNNDRIFNPGAEDLGLAYRDFVVDEDTTEYLSIAMSSTYEAPPVVAGINAVNNRQITIKLDRQLEFLPAAQQIMIVDTITQRQLKVTGIFQHPMDSTRVLLFTEPQDSIEYLIKITGGEDFCGMIMNDSLYFKGSVQADTIPPKLLKITAEGDSLSSVMELITSEEVDTAKLRESIVFVDSLKARPKLSVTESRYSVYNLKSPDIHPRDSIAVNLKALVDLYGNIGADSLIIVTISEKQKESEKEDKGSISGEALFFGEQPMVIVLMQHSTEIATMVLKNNGPFKFDNVVSGYYTFKAYIDSDGNHRYDAGLWNPFRHSERFVMSADSFRVRERWETSGVEISIGKNK